MGRRRQESVVQTMRRHRRAQGQPAKTMVEDASGATWVMEHYHTHSWWDMLWAPFYCGCALYAEGVSSTICIVVSLSVWVLLWSERPFVPLRRWLRRRRVLRASVQCTTPPMGFSGIITLACVATLPVLFRTTHPLATVTTQAFVVESAEGPVLVDTPYVEAVGVRSADSGTLGQVRGLLSVSVGDRVFVSGGELRTAPAPTWFTGPKLTHFRERRLRHLAATSQDAIQLLVLRA